MSHKPEWTQLILQALETDGPMSNADAQAQFGITRQQAGAVFSRLLKPTQRPTPGPKRVHICEWRYDAETGRKYPRPVYAIGDKPNAKKPKRNHKEVSRRYRANRKRKLMNSIFNVSLTRAQRKEMTHAAQA